jgi:aryl-alcohol dehydrogenase-like predicted oxidoreductase
VTAPIPAAGRLGRSGLEVTRIGLGLAAAGRPGYINVGHHGDLAHGTGVDAMEAAAHALLDAAFAGGIRYLDAARSYGKAEQFLASWLERRALRPGAVTVGSKWGYTYRAGWRIDAEQHEVKDLSVETLRRQLAETRALLGDRLSLYQIHSATIESGVLDDARVLATLAELRREGLAVGLTVTGPRQRETIERAVELGAFDSVQATWNLLEQSAGPALAVAHGAGMGVIVKEALANGRLTDRGDVPALLRAAARRHVGADALALAAVLDQPWADVVLSGAVAVDALESNLTATAVAVDGDLAHDLAGIVRDPAVYWQERAALPWN